MSIQKNIYTRTGYIINYNEGDLSLHRIKVSIPVSNSDKWYTTLENDTLTELAFRFYGEPHLWDIIADVNDIHNPWDDLESGTELRIPSQNSIDSFNNNSRL